ncbi:ATP-binding protein [Kitasatospora kifunensis]|uniref:Anti-sigma regulatory factor (Ser/Thr protein kinase) n=1 Tax=Kitasatospora kifunensis TaxID=58351 RepID=A0A7W7RB81_KITKI|nr:ATP-binding protein [Kitasatospora kifunensis]MBB4928802.1 anti-sigma regulatory factor (Ser/Thr protein kinase) [Kitasatospora kifunensis]
MSILSGPSPRPAPGPTQAPARGAAPATRESPGRTRHSQRHHTLYDWTPTEPNPTSPVRRRLRAALAALRVPADAVDDAVLMASELVANAHRHAPGAGRLRLVVTATTVRVEVHDGNPRLPGPGPCSGSPPAPGRRSGEIDCPSSWLAESGRGLRIVHALSGGRWGSRTTASGKHVWFALPRPVSHSGRGPLKHPGRPPEYEGG